MADHVLDHEPPPAELQHALLMRTWGVDALDAPAWMMASASPALNAYNVLSAYAAAGAQGQGAKWGQDNPHALDFVSAILRDRFDRRKARKVN